MNLLKKHVSPIFPFIKGEDDCKSFLCNGKLCDKESIKLDRMTSKGTPLSHIFETQIAMPCNKCGRLHWWEDGEQAVDGMNGKKLFRKER